MSDPMVLDTDAQLDMSLDALIAAKTKGQKNRTQSVSYSASGAGKVRSTGRVERRLHSMPYARENPVKPMGLSMRRVYVGNLAWGVTWKELKDHMKQAGWVVKADVAIDSSGRSKGGVAAAVYRSEVKMSTLAAPRYHTWKIILGRRNAHILDFERGAPLAVLAVRMFSRLVEFQTTSHARAAINTLQDTDLMGRPIFLREDREAWSNAPARGNGVSGAGSSGSRSINCKVFVSNLAYEVAWQDLKDHMRQAGNVLRADLFIGYDGRSKGLGIVEYSKPFEARNAIAQLGDTILMGRPIAIREERGDAVGHAFLGNGVGGAVGARVYVGNLSWDASWQDLKDHMRQAGDVKFVDLFQVPGGRSKGCAVVEYKNPQHAQVAIRDLNDTELRGRVIFVREDREEGSAASKSQGPMSTRFPGAAGRQVHVGNLSWETGWQDVKDHFRQVGHVEFVEIPEDAQGRSRGDGIVRFGSEQDARRAIDALNDTELQGRQIVVREA